MVANLCGVWIAAVLTDGHVLNVFGPSSYQIRKTSVDFVKERDWPAASDAKMICSLPRTMHPSTPANASHLELASG
jgi:hypothetical protein